MTRPVHVCLVVLLAWQFRFVFQRSFVTFQGVRQPQGSVARTTRRVRERRQASPRPRPKQADSYTPAKVITSRVKTAASAPAILAVMQSERENPNMDLIAVAAAWCQLARLKQGIDAEVTKSQSFAMFVIQTRSTLQRPETLEAQAVSNILWSAARLRSSTSSQLKALWISLARAVKATARQMIAQGVANSIWAVATLATTNTDSEALLTGLPALAKRLPAVISEMTRQAFSNVIWATGQLSADHSHAALSQDLRKVLPVVVTQARVELPSATPQALANSCWGLALSDTHDAAFLQAVAERVASEAAGWQSKLAELTLPSVLCSFARLKAVGHDDMLDVAANNLSLMIGEMNDWGLCATLWSYQQLDRGEFLTFQRRLEAEVVRRQLLTEDVERSRMGPEVWQMDGGQSKRT
ncbi:unnamed protein product [Effrenium voratum]|uniref:Uncharacterized protein n=1 Tax=Effrenium voratum TaxID=2562239 RepID=A0AA36JLV8_9DINO|nr:unnamed protein product [Effrenium voratum]CAJ1425159.1 unnamed protein product [Effrenium voratum]